MREGEKNKNEKVEENGKTEGVKREKEQNE